MTDLEGAAWRGVAAARLRAAAAPDGGFGPRAGAAGEPETTAVAALALDDQGGRDWLAGHQRRDGRYSVIEGPVDPAAPTSLAALALPEGTARERALDALVAMPARITKPEPVAPRNPVARGWGWTTATYGWVEPTSWAVLALKRLRPQATAGIADGERMLADRECVNGGWNYGNRTVYGDDLRPYVQTTATAVIALQRSDRADVLRRGQDLLADRWRAEPGGLSLALALAAMRLHGMGGADDVAVTLGEVFERSAFLGDVLTLAWAVLATGPGIETLRVAP